MKSFEEIMNIGNIDLKGSVIEESFNSTIVLVKKKIYVPEKEDHPYGSYVRTGISYINGCEQK